MADRYAPWIDTNNQSYSGFVDGIVRLNRIFDSHPLESFALGYIDPPMEPYLRSLWRRGIARLQDPEMHETYKELLEADEKDPINPLLLPWPMQEVLAYVAASNGVDGRAQQRRVDMHTQWNSAAVLITDDRRRRRERKRMERAAPGYFQEEGEQR